MQSKHYHGYIIFSNGDIIGLQGGRLTQSIRLDRKQVRLVINGVRKSFTTARLVYCVFNDIDIDTMDKDQCVTFKDGDKLNVALDNLEVVYRGDLIQGEKHKSRSKLTDSEVEEIKEKYESTKDNKPVNQYDNDKPYNSYRSLAKEYGVTYTMIKHIVKGDSRNSKKYILNEDNKERD